MKFLLLSFLFMTGFGFMSLRHIPDREYTRVQNSTLPGRDSSRALEKEVRTLRVWWVPHMYLLAYPSCRERSADGYFGKAFHIEAADSSLTLPENFDMMKHSLLLTGQFYKEKFCPIKVSLYGDKKAMKMSNDSCVAKVFRYTKVEIVY